MRMVSISRLLLRRVESIKSVFTVRCGFAMLFLSMVLACSDPGVLHFGSNTNELDGDTSDTESPDGDNPNLSDGDEEDETGPSTCGMDACGLLSNGLWCGGCPVGQYCRAEDVSDLEAQGGICVDVEGIECNQSDLDNRESLWRMTGAGPENRGMLLQDHAYRDGILTAPNPPPSDFLTEDETVIRASMISPPWLPTISILLAPPPELFHPILDTSEGGLELLFGSFPYSGTALGAASFAEASDGFLVLLKQEQSQSIARHNLIQYKPSLEDQIWTLTEEDAYPWDIPFHEQEALVSFSYPILRDRKVYYSAAGKLIKLTAPNPDDTTIQQSTHLVSIYNTTAPSLDCHANVYLGSADRHLYSISSRMTDRWSRELGGYLVHAPVIDHRQRVIVGSYDFNLYVFSNTGQHIWQRDLNGRITQPPAVDLMDNIYVVAGLTLYKLSPGGEILWTTSLSGNTSSRPIVNALGWCFLITDTAFYGFPPESGTPILEHYWPNKLIQPSPMGPEIQAPAPPALLPNGQVVLPFIRSYDESNELALTMDWYVFNPDGYHSEN